MKKTNAPQRNFTGGLGESWGGLGSCGGVGGSWRDLGGILGKSWGSLWGPWGGILGDFGGILGGSYIFETVRLALRCQPWAVLWEERGRCLDAGSDNNTWWGTAQLGIADLSFKTCGDMSWCGYLRFKSGLWLGYPGFIWLNLATKSFKSDGQNPFRMFFDALLRFCTVWRSNLSSIDAFAECWSGWGGHIEVALGQARWSVQVPDGPYNVLTYMAP